MDIAIIPRPLIRRMISSEQDGIHVNVILSSLLLFGMFVFPSSLHFITALPHFCLFEHFLGVPCPGCNITLALAQLAHLDIAKSISTQPGGIALVLTVTFQVAVRSLALGRFVTFVVAQSSALVATHLFFLFLVLYWIFTLFIIH